MMSFVISRNQFESIITIKYNFLSLMMNKIVGYAGFRPYGELEYPT